MAPWNRNRNKKKAEQQAEDERLRILAQSVGWQTDDASASAAGADTSDVGASDIPFQPEIDDAEPVGAPDGAQMSEGAQMSQGSASDASFSARRTVRRTPADPIPKRVRGLSKGAKTEKMVKATGQRIALPYDDFTYGPPNPQLASLSAHSIGAIIRNNVRMIAPTWRELPDEEKERVFRQLSVHFDVAGTPEMMRHINSTANTIYKDWKYRLHKYYMRVGPSPPPVELREERLDEWEWLLNHFQQDEYVTRSNANKGNRDKKEKHHSSGSRGILQIAKQHKDKGSKHPYLDANLDAYVKPGVENEASQQGARLIELAQEELTNSQLAYPDLPPADLPPLSRESQIAIADEVYGRRAGKEVRGFGRKVHRDLSSESSTGHTQKTTYREEVRRTNEAMLAMQRRLDEQQQQIAELMAMMQRPPDQCQHTPFQRDDDDDRMGGGGGIGVAPTPGPTVF